MVGERPTAFAECQPRQHAGEKVEDVIGGLVARVELLLQHQAEDEEVRQHQQQRIQDRPGRPAERPAIAAQDVAPRHALDEAAIGPERFERQRDGAA
jgi:hypothetical protein